MVEVGVRVTDQAPLAWLSMEATDLARDIVPNTALGMSLAMTGH